MPSASGKRVFDELSQIDEDLDNRPRQSRSSDDTPDYLDQCKKAAKIARAARPSASVKSTPSAKNTRPPQSAASFPVSRSKSHDDPGRRVFSDSRQDDGGLTSTVRRESAARWHSADATNGDPRRNYLLQQPRSFSDPEIEVFGQTKPAFHRAEGPSKEPRIPARLNQKAVASSFGAPAQSTGPPKVPSTGKKGMKKVELNMAPEERQLFRGKTFFWFPPSRGSGPRRLRVRRSLEHGAKLAEEWGGDITHIMVDSSLGFSDLIKWLDGRKIPEGVPVVDADYPSSCLHLQQFLDPKQSRFLVKGCPDDKSKKPPTTPARQNKAAGLSVYAGETPEAEKPRKPASVETVRTVSTPFDSNERSELDVVEDHRILQVLSSADKTKTRDALDEAIEETKRFQHLPLDQSENEATEASDPNISDAESESSKVVTRGEMSTVNKSAYGNYSCMNRNDGKGNEANPNTRTIEILQQMQTYYEQTRDTWRSIAYRKAIGALKKETRKIVTAQEAAQIPSIGARLADKIEEIVCTDRLQRLENAKLEPQDEVLQRFLKVYGAGYVQATAWVRKGYQTLDDLMNKANLTRNQKIGVERYNDFQVRIPRAEMTQHDHFVKAAARKLDPEMQLTIGGSYRRGAADSGDIDFIVTKPNSTIDTVRTLVLDTLVPYLAKKDYLKVALQVASRSSGDKWHGAACLPGHTVWRRIDFLIVPWDEMGAALIYFTGNDIFNRSLRLLASKKGMRLNQQALWKDVIVGKSRERLTQGTVIESKDERKIFELLGVPWRPPEHRLC